MAPEQQQQQYDIAIIGAGIVGSTLASFLAPHTKLALIDRSVRELRGSTGHAPGFVGQLNVLAPLTELAVRTVQHYKTTPAGFDVVGGLEVARTEAEVANLSERAALAASRGLEARVVGPEEARALAPDFVDSSSTVSALHFPNDGTANARGIAHAGQDAARAAGAALFDADVQGITRGADGFLLSTSAGEVRARKIVVCTGVWAGQLLPTLNAATVSVVHPYAYSRVRPPREARPPFVRWPAAHVYARDHGQRDGIGSYAHDPIHVTVTAMAGQASAYGEWEAVFDGVVDSALSLLPRQTADAFRPLNVPAAAKVEVVKATEVPYAFNGLFTVTPDGMPLVGTLEPDLYCGVGVWVTQAGGAARLLADIILEDLGKGDKNVKDEALRAAIGPKRFVGKDEKVLEAAALASYNDIYNKDKQ